MTLSYIRANHWDTEIAKLQELVALAERLQKDIELKSRCSQLKTPQYLVTGRFQAEETVEKCQILLSLPNLASASL